MKKRNFYFINLSIDGVDQGALHNWKPQFQKTVSKNFNWIELSAIYDSFDHKFLIKKDWPCWKDDDSFISFSSIWPNTCTQFFDDEGWIWTEKTMLNFFNDNRDFFFDYKGKILFVNDGDEWWRNVNLLINSYYVDIIDGFMNLHISGSIATDYEQGMKLLKKTILLPKWTLPWDHINVSETKKKMGIYFNGGFDSCRAEIVKRIKNSEINSYFEGGISRPGKYGGYGRPFTNEYMRENDYIFVERLELFEYLNKMNESLISMCGFQENGTFSYRHVESLMLGCGIISGDFSREQDHVFLYRDKVLPLLYIIKHDLSDLLEVCQYCLDNENEIRLRGKEGIEVYKKYWELNEDSSYKDNVWRDIQAQFLELNIDI